MKVFYSWQSDTPSKIGRAFLRDCLDKAISGLEVDESDRPTVDQDTQDVLGSPVIADKIFEKIRDAKVVVVDVTLTGQTPAGKCLANSNAAIELGYALGIHGDKVLLKIMNVHYGPPEDLPFASRIGVGPYNSTCHLTHRRRSAETCAMRLFASFGAFSSCT